MPTPSPILKLQLASLYASGDASTFTGTGGPAAYDPFLAQFSDIVSSQGIAAEPFADEVYDVDAGDQVTFVIALQNFANSTSAYDVTLRNTVPAGFTLPAVSDLTVTDGTGAAVGYSGNLFDPSGGLTISSPVAPYSDTSGANVLLVTFTLEATQALAVPLATVTDSAQVVSYAASEGGPNLSGSATPGSLTASTPVQTGAITVAAVADQPAGLLEPGHTDQFDVTVTLPEGTVNNLRIAELTPHSGTAWLQVVSAQIVQMGGNLSATGPLTLQPDGSIALGNVTDTPDNVSDAGDQIVVRVTVSGGGTTAGTGTLQSVVSAADPSNPGGTWSTSVTSTVQIDAPDTPPTIAGVSPNQNATSSMVVLPFAGLLLTDPDAGQVETLTVHLSDPALGALTGPAAVTTNANGDVVISGAIAAVQAAARTLAFQPGTGASGAETISLRLDDGYGGIATSAATTVTVSQAADTSAIPHFPLATSQPILTSTPNGSSTYSATENYAGVVSSATSQFVYDGSAPLAIVALQPNVLVQSVATATAVQVLSGTNTVDIRSGSGFVTSGSGNDTFLFDATGGTNTWDTILNFHTGDSLLLWGFTQGTSTMQWEASNGAPGYRGSTLHMDLNADGITDASITFAGKTATDTGRYTIGYGNNSGVNFISIIAA